ncbi:MAG TPA: hypothetical protein VHA37_05720 [Candidatus Saccharimonadales bacterium]|nr:hypothetical protein [Candidatus Saccharimonadales bacterium]
MRRYIISFFVTLGLIALLIILLLSGGNKPKTPGGQTLPSYASTDAQVSVLIDGPINADSLHNQILITVDNTNVTYEHLTGYDGTSVDTRVYSNTEAAYDAFLHALYHAGFTEGNNDPKLRDESGYCPTEDRYIFELTQDNNTLERYWNTTCNHTKTYEGDTGLTLRLFKAQVPDYNALTQNIAL